MKFLLNLIYVYILIYSVYFLYISVRNIISRKFAIQHKYKDTAHKKHLCLILYTHNNEQKLSRMLKCIAEQDYDQSKISVFAILDNCDDNSEKLPIAKNVQFFTIKNQGKVGKKQAVSILVEKLHEYKFIDAFVFLDINKYIEKDFFSSVNSAMSDYDVISGATMLFGESLNIRQKIKKAYQKYRMNFMYRARALAGLYTDIDSGICAISRDVINNVGCPDFENLEKDLEYSATLAKENCKYSFNPNVKTYSEVHEYKIRIPRLSKRVNVFFKNISHVITPNTSYIEYIFSMISPNVVFTLLAYAILIKTSMSYYFNGDFSLLILSLCMLALGFTFSLVNSNFRGRDVLVLSLYPIYSLFHVLKHFPLWRFIKRRVCNEIEPKEPEETYEIDVDVTDGRGSVPCKLILISECGMTKAKFIFKNKKFVTKTHLRTFDAIEEIINKLAEYGFTLKICQACTNFTSNHDGSTNLIKGFCNQQFKIAQQGEISVVLWNSCKGFTPKVMVKNFKG